MSKRLDSVGLWWQDYEAPKTAGGGAARVARVINVAVPETGWTPPKEFPNLAAAKTIALDTETKDLEFEERGPGAVRGVAHAIGISVAVDDASWYFPIRHEYEPQKHLNMDPAKVFAWLQEVLNQRKKIVGSNLFYDFEVLRAEGLKLPEEGLHDVLYAEPLIDENAHTYNLDVLGEKYLGRGKETSTLFKWCSDSFGGSSDEQRGNLWRSPPTLVGPYAEADSAMPLRIIIEQYKELESQELTAVYDLERGLIPLLLDMRFRGVRIDIDRAVETARWLREEAARFQGTIPGVDVWSPASIARAFDKQGIEYERTAAGNPSFTKQWLELQHGNPLAEAVLNVRLYEKAANPFVESYILEKHHNGRLFCQFNPLRNDQYGTVSGRFSSSNPNLQNIPARHPVLAKRLRSLFVPEEGCRWKRGDYNQVEYRGLTHYAIGRGAEEIRERYRRDPTTDFHGMTQDMAREIVGIVLERRPAKNLNFGLVYGMGKDKTVRSLGTDVDLGTRLYESYHRAMPCVRETFKSAERLANRRGFVKTILGRRRRFTRWETDKQTKQKRRQGTHAALNAVLQGTAADIMKKAMYDLWKSGVFNVIGVPHLTVHDELDWSDPGGCDEAWAETKSIMENCIKLEVPLLVDFDEGADWGDCL